MSRATDRALFLPEDRRAFWNLSGTYWGWETSAGYRLFSGSHAAGALSAWAGAPWWDWDHPTYGARLEVLF